MADLVGTVEISKINRYSSLSAIIKLSEMAVTKVANCENLFYNRLVRGPTEFAYFVCCET